MNREELQALSSEDLNKLGAELGINTKGQNKRHVIEKILQKIEGQAAEEKKNQPAAGDGEGDDLPENPGVPTDEQIIAAERGDMEGEEDDPAPEDLIGLSHEEILERKIQDAEERGDAATASALVAALDALQRSGAATNAAVPEAPAAEHDRGPHVATQGYAPRIKAGMDWPTPEEVRELLKSHVKRGLKIRKLDNKMWEFQFGVKDAAGTMKMPMRQILMQANILMRNTARPTEDMDFDEILTMRRKAMSK